MNYLVQLTSEAEKEWKLLDRITQDRVRQRLKELALDPYGQRFSKSVRMLKDIRTARVGNWRILFEVNESSKTIDIIAIRPRGKAYK